MWCVYCGHEWFGGSMYCPRCGLSAEAAPGPKGKIRPEFVAELIVAAVATAVVFWLAGKA